MGLRDLESGRLLKLALELFDRRAQRFAGGQKLEPLAWVGELIAAAGV